MNNVFVYCETEGTVVAEVSQELLTKGRKLASELGVELHAIVAGTGIKAKSRTKFCPMVSTSCGHSTPRVCSPTLRLPTPRSW